MNSSKESYLVVVFPNDKPVSVEVVPSTWLISQEECYWPPRCSSSQIKKFIFNPKTKKSTTPTIAWARCVCRILGEFATIELAREACKRGEVTSDIELQETKSNRRRKRSWSSSDDSNDGYEQKSSKCNSPVTPFTGPPATALYSGSLTAETNNFELPITLSLVGGGIDNTINNTTSNPIPSSEDLNYSQFSGESCNVKLLNGSTREQEVITIKTGFTPVTPQSSSTEVSNGFQRVVLRHIATIQSTQKDILQKLDAILENQAGVDTAGSGNNENLSLTYDYSCLPIFPLETTDALQDFDSQLLIEKERTTFIRYLVGIGGTKLEDTVKLILKRIIHEDLAKILSYTGRGKNKKAFNIYTQIDACITVATKKNRKIANDADKTEVGIKQVMMDFFRYSR